MMLRDYECALVPQARHFGLIRTLHCLPSKRRRFWMMARAVQLRGDLRQWVMLRKQASRAWECGIGILMTPQAVLNNFAGATTNEPSQTIPGGTLVGNTKGAGLEQALKEGLLYLASYRFRRGPSSPSGIYLRIALSSATHNARTAGDV